MMLGKRVLLGTPSSLLSARAVAVGSKASQTNTFLHQMVSLRISYPSGADDDEVLRIDSADQPAGSGGGHQGGDHKGVVREGRPEHQGG